MLRTAISTAVVAVALHAVAASGVTSWWGTVEARDTKANGRAEAIARAHVWAPTQVAMMNVKAGPNGNRSFAFHQTIQCDHLPKELEGMSPKFACVVGEDDELKVKYGGTNAEVYAEVAATRLMWALGFGADHMYPVRVVCRGCPQMLGGILRDDETSVFDPASVERKMPGREFPGTEGWTWQELDQVKEESGGAPRAHRDALKLMAVFLQHSDTKRQQQRLLCLGDAPTDKDDTRCERPLMMVNDLGLTFGRANRFNVNSKGMNLVEWAATPVWKDGAGCVGNLPKSFTGTLDNPQISEAGRRFLADLLSQLSDEQITDLFEVARVHLRLREPGKVRSGYATIGEWVDAFKQKRMQITDKRCA
jgi:hypothetical protein